MYNMIIDWKPKRKTNFQFFSYELFLKTHFPEMVTFIFSIISKPNLLQELVKLL